MIETYKTLAEFAQTWGLLYFVVAVRARASPTRSGRRNKQQFDDAARTFRCGRTEPWPPDKPHVDAVTGTATTGHEWDGITRAEHAAAALVAVAVLRHHRLGDRLLDRLSGLAAGVSLHHGRARLAVARRRSRPTSPALQGAARRR